MNSGLWLPESLKELLCIDADEAKDASDPFEAMMVLNQATVDWINGKLDTGTYTDIYLQYGISPTRIDETEAFVQQALKQLPCPLI